MESRFSYLNLVEEPIEAEVSGISRLSRMLRYLGAVLLFGSAIAFSLQGWKHWGSLLRHSSFLGFVVAISCLGVWCGVVWKETKGARTFLGVAAAMIPAIFAQLGAMLFDFLTPQGFLGYSSLPKYLQYQAPSISLVGLAFGATLILTTLMSYAAFNVFFRKHAVRLTQVFVFINLLILLPFRSEIAVVVIALGVLGLLFYTDLNLFSKSSESSTWEGRAARLMLLAPLVIITGRTFVFYSFSHFGSALISFLFAIASIFFLSRNGNVIKTNVLSLIAVLSSISAWSFFVGGVLAQLSDAYGPYFLWEFRPLIYGVPMSLIIFGLSYLFNERGGSYRVLASILGGYSTMCFVNDYGGIIPSFVCSLFGVFCVLIATAHRERAPMYCGIACFLYGIISQCLIAIKYISISPWVSLGIAGVFAVGAAVYLERKGDSLISTFKLKRQALAEWD